MKKPKLLGFHAELPMWLKLLTGAIPIMLAIMMYMHYGETFREANPDSMLMPSYSDMMETADAYLFEPESKRKPTPKLWADTYASVTNLLIGMSISALLALAIGLHYGLLKGIDGLLGPVTSFIGFIPPILMVPIVIVTMGKGDWAKITLIVLGMTFVMAANIKNYVRDYPEEFLTKTKTLNASWFGVLYRTYLPLMLPRLIDQVKNNIGTGWVMLFTAEFVAASQGLGYRIYITRRWLDMSVIVPYMIWIAVLSFILIFFLNTLKKFTSKWAENA